jgi:hypothetical protein
MVSEGKAEAKCTYHLWAWKWTQAGKKIGWKEKWMGSTSLARVGNYRRTDKKS